MLENAFAYTLRLGSFGLGLSIGGRLQLKLWVILRELSFFRLNDDGAFVPHKRFGQKTVTLRSSGVIGYWLPALGKH